MRRLLFFIFAANILSSNALAQDATHAKTFKMDGMTLKEYYFVMLVSGKRRDEIKDTATINKIQAGHMANMKKLADAGKLLVAGPFGDETNWRGIFILDCATQKEAEELLATDPAIKAGRLDYEIHPWWTAINSVFK